MKSKRILITSTDLMMIQFLAPHVRKLCRHGFSVEIACSEVDGRMESVGLGLEDVVDAIYQVRLVRSPAALTNFLGFLDLRAIIRRGKYDLIWTNEPVMGALTRLAARNARKQGTKVVYMCHGFHFFKGSGIWNWLAFYPVEWLLSFITDVTVTINREDEARAKTMGSGRVAYIRGVGVDTRRLLGSGGDIRRELGLREQDFLVLSVGELNRNKNYGVILQAIAALGDPDIHYALCGTGDQKKALAKLAQKLGISNRVHFLGYRRDLGDIYRSADVFVHPAIREGLGLAPLEAMYCGLPLVAADSRGLRDYAREGGCFLHDPGDFMGFAESIRSLKETGCPPRCRETNRQAAESYCLEQAEKEVLAMIEEALDI